VSADADADAGADTVWASTYSGSLPVQYLHADGSRWHANVYPSAQHQGLARYEWAVAPCAPDGTPRGFVVKSGFHQTMSGAKRAAEAAVRELER